MNKKKVSANYLDFVPKHNPEVKFEIDREGNVTIFQENKGVFNFLAQKLLFKPRVSQIHLDEMGNFIYPLIDGKKTIMDISVLVKEHFGDKAEPLYNRLVIYFQMLDEYKFIIIDRVENK